MAALAPDIHDKVIIEKAPEGAVCFSARCREEGRPAAVTVRFGRLSCGLWRESWGRTYAMCAQDADETVAALRKHPEIAIAQPDEAAR